jgi:hypothetical protein
MTKYVFTFMRFIQFLTTLFRYISQYEEDSMTDLAKYSAQERKESVKDIPNLGLVVHLESVTAPNLHRSQEAAKKSKQENVSPAVNIFWKAEAALT